MKRLFFVFMLLIGINNAANSVEAAHHFSGVHSDLTTGCTYAYAGYWTDAGTWYLQWSGPCGSGSVSSGIRPSGGVEPVTSWDDALDKYELEYEVDNEEVAVDVINTAAINTEL